MSRLFSLPALALCALSVFAVPPEDPNAPPPAKGSAAEALLSVRVSTDLKVTVWAAEPLMANPVSFCFDEKGRAYVTETTRFDKGVPDTRSHMYWLDDDLACRTVADRVAMYHRTYGRHKPYLGFEKFDDQVRMVWDSTGSGKADQSSVFSKGYNKPEDGIGSGVLARKGNVYYTNIPSLYLLKDTTGDHIADQKNVLATGFGVRVQFLGHDMHGLRMGPDGKLYFSIGDRAFNVKNKEGNELVNTESGAVLRCDLDGSNLEIVHVGLRNPQELAFDDYGNLFTYDNNCDSGDQARWVQIVEGGDSGWRCGYQYGSGYHTPDVRQGNRGPWNTDKIWHVPGPNGGPPAYVVPPLKTFGSGPSGITHYPGIGLNSRYKDHFFACDFTSSKSSRIWSLVMKPKGASFEVDDLHPFVQGMVPTDCDFGPDGAFYWSDWVGGWSPPGKGRIFRLTDPEAMKNPAIAEAKELLAGDFEKLDTATLAKLLHHPHQMVRFEAQYALANVEHGPRKPLESVSVFSQVAKDSKNQLARLHAVWGLGIAARTTPAAVSELIKLAEDSDAEVRAQVNKTLASLPTTDAMNAVFARALVDAAPRVRFYAALGWGKTLAPSVLVKPGSGQARYVPLFELLKSNNDQDAYLRHAAVIGLTELARNPDDLWNAWVLAKEKYDTPAVRLGVLLALRRSHSAKTAEFLKDVDLRIVNEAARGIHDERIAGALPALAALAEKPGLPDATSFRALSACYMQGSAADANRVARFAARASEPEYTRVFALKLLGDWADPPRRDPITGNAIRLPKRPANIAADVLRPVISGVFAGSDKVRAEAASVSAKLKIKEVGPLMAGIVKDAKAPVSNRVDALIGLAYLKDPATKELTAFALNSDQPRLRAAGRSLAAKSEPARVITSLPALLDNPKVSLAEKQGAFAILASAPQSEAADQLLAQWLDRVNAGKAPSELVLDILEAGESRAKAKLKHTISLKPKVDAFRKAKDRIAAQPKGDKLAPWSDSLAGGDVDKGRNIFLNNSAVYCQRCHKLDGQGGDVGPLLNGIATQMGKDRRYFLEAIVNPSANIAKGYETAVLTLVDGRVVSGVVKEDTKKALRIITAENKELIIPVDDIEARRTGPSAMPDDLHKKLSHRELRDLVEFLSSLKEPEKKDL